MPRVRAGSARNRKKRRLFRDTSGYRGPRKNRYRMALEAVLRAGTNAYRDRKRRKREFRSLWIIRLSAACGAHDIQYSRFINGLKKDNIFLNRKMLSELAIHDPAAFGVVVEHVKEALGTKQAA